MISSRAGGVTVCVCVCVCLCVCVCVFETCRKVQSTFVIVEFQEIMPAAKSEK